MADLPTKDQIRQRAIDALATQPTYAERLVEVRAAISALLKSGQSVSYEGRSLQLANLSELRKLEGEYESKANAELAEAPARNRVYYPRPIT